MERFRKRFWAPALEAAGLDGEWVPHELRHTAVTLWRMADVRIEVAAKWLGHRDTRLVTDLYSHVADLEGVEDSVLILLNALSSRRPQAGSVVRLLSAEADSE